MAREIPSAPRVYTTTYDNFKGVDYTNDSTNVWRRRSPTGYNMLPDASGRPFKRNGWQIFLSSADLAETLDLYGYEYAEIDEEIFNEDKTKYYTYDSEEEEYIQCTDEDEFDDSETYFVYTYPSDFQITKCAYFDLAGTDHIVVFTSMGVIFYNGEVTATNTDMDCYTGYDRCFFFEGNGTSAFYIYGGHKVWRYGADFTLVDCTSECTIPRIIISASANGTGDIYEGYNLLYPYASVEYNDYELFTYWGTDGLNFSVNETTFKSGRTMGSPSFYKWKYNGSSWVWNASGTAQTFSGITTVSPKADDEIAVVWCKGLMLPNNVALQQKDEVVVRATTSLQFDTLLKTVDTSPSAVDEVCLHLDDVKREHRQAWLEFKSNSSYKTGATFDGMDTFKTVFPTREVNVTSYGDGGDYPAEEDELTPDYQILDGEVIT